MGVFEDLNKAGLQAIGLNPQWVDVSLGNATGPPNSAGDGVFLENSPKAQVYVALREDASLRTSRVVLGVKDLTVTVYTVIVNGFSVIFDAAVETPATPLALAEGIRDKINADVTVGPLVLAILDPLDTTNSTIKLTGKAEADYSIDATAVGGIGTLTFNADSSSCDLRVYVTPGGIIANSNVGNEDRWVEPLDGFHTPIVFRGFVERFDVAGLRRLYPRITSLVGFAGDGVAITLNLRLMVGPSVIQATT